MSAGFKYPLHTYSCRFTSNPDPENIFENFSRINNYLACQPWAKIDAFITTGIKHSYMVGYTFVPVESIRFND